MSGKKLLEEKRIDSLDQLKKWVDFFSTQLTWKDVILLNGEMGTGKTQFVKFLVEALYSKHPDENNFNVKEEVCSPTYSIHNNYLIGEEQSFDHIDLYRLTDEDDIESTGFWDLFLQNKGIIAVEWSNRLGDEFKESIVLSNWNVWNIDLKKCDSDKEEARVISCKKS